MLIWQLQIENGLITFGKRNSSKTIQEIVNHSELNVLQRKYGDE
jgi:hypothetical protein